MLEKPNLSDEETAAELAGGKHEKRRRVANFIGGKRAGSTRSAARLSHMRRECGSDPPLWRDSHISQL
ncbi:MAG: hypothetical protein ABI690_04695 [Chloroflexota bacterium]